jgi:hypothetical protein
MTRNTARICAVAEYEDAITCLGYASVQVNYLLITTRLWG